MIGNKNIANDHTQKISWKRKILRTCLQGNYRDSLGELGITSAYGVFWA